MGKRKTITMAIICAVLAALIVAATVFGATLSRSAFTDTDDMNASEARWRVVPDKNWEGWSEETKLEVSGIRPSAEAYGSQSGARVGHNLYYLGTVENLGEVTASVSVAAGEITPTLEVQDGDTDRYDYTAEDIMEHFECVFCWAYSYNSDDPGDAGYDDVTSSADGGGAPLGPAEDENSTMYVYVDVAWTSDLADDVSGNGYDGTEGDLFDSWANRHLSSLAFTLTITATQAE